MRNHPSPSASRLLVIALAVLAAAPLSRADAQSDRQLRRENERLRTEVSDLTRQLEETRRQLGDLQARNVTLEQAIAQVRGATSPPTTTPPAPEQVSIDESIATASPRALFRALVDDYRATFADMDPATDDEKQRALVLRALERWNRRVNRELKGQVTWHVRVLRGRQELGEYILNVVAVDPVHDTQLGDPFDVLLSSAIARRVEQMQRRGETDVLVLRGAMLPQVRIDRQRLEEGPFNNPPLIGPMAEFDLTVTATSLTPPESAGKARPATTGGRS